MDKKEITLTDIWHIYEVLARIKGEEYGCEVRLVGLRERGKEEDDEQQTGLGDTVK